MYVEQTKVQLLRPPVAVPVWPGSARKRAFGYVVHGCLLRGGLGAFHRSRCFSTLFLRNASHQVKLTLMIAAIRYSDDSHNSQAIALFRCAGAALPLRTRGGSLRDLAAGA